MTDFPDLKVKALVNFPADVRGGTGVTVTKAGLAYTFDLDYGELSLITSVPSLPTAYLVLWDSSQNTFRRISLTNLKTVLGIP